MVLLLSSGAFDGQDTVRHQNVSFSSRNTEGIITIADFSPIYATRSLLNLMLDATGRLM